MLCDKGRCDEAERSRWRIADREQSLASYEKCLQLALETADARYSLASLCNRQKALRHLNAHRRLQQ